MSRKKWIVSGCDKDVAAHIAESCGIEPFTAYLLCSRGYTDEFAVDSYLYDDDICDPYLLPDMERAVGAVREAIQSGKRVTVFGDYDADGVTATALLYMYLKSKGANVDFYIPDRAVEGYGMNRDAIAFLKNRGTQFIITVDNGISADGEVKYAKELGIETVITDHHRPGGVLPDALAVVDPHREDYAGNFKDWAGVGVAFKLVCALEDCDCEKILGEYSDIIALGTIADIVALKGENRVLVRRGIEHINRRERIGLKALKAAAGLDGRKTTSISAAFTLAPRINAAGRMGCAHRALRLLVTSSLEEADILSGEICAANDLRKKEESDIERAALRQITENPAIGYERVIVVDGENWHQGVIGIVASHLCDMFGKPVIVISRDGASAKGSGRSTGGFSLYEALSAVSAALDRFGGHNLAAGMSLPSENIELFRRKINEYAAQNEPSFPTLNIDCKINPASLKLELLGALDLLEPYGAGNHPPLFGLFNMQIVNIQPVGNGRHIKLNLQKGGSNVTAMFFGVSADEFMYCRGDFVDLAVRLDKSEYMGENKLSVHVKNIRFAGADDEEALKCKDLYERFKRGESLSLEGRLKLKPDRELQENLYRHIKSGDGSFLDAELLCKRLALEPSRAAAVSVALDVFFELSLIEYTADSKKAVPVYGVKADLNRSRILSSLKGA